MIWLKRVSFQPGSCRRRGSGEADFGLWLMSHVLTSHLPLGAAARQIPSRCMEQACSGRWDPCNRQGQRRGPVWWVLVNGAQCAGTGSGLGFIGKGLAYPPFIKPNPNQAKPSRNKKNQPQTNSAFLTAGGDASWSWSNGKPSELSLSPSVAGGVRPPESVPSLHACSSAGSSDGAECCSHCKGMWAMKHTRRWAVTPRIVRTALPLPRHRAGGDSCKKKWDQ